MSGALGSIGGLLAPIAGGFLGSGLGELAGNVFGSTASSLLTPTILADIGGAVGGAGAGALANPRNRGLGAGLGGIEGLLTGPGLTNLTGVSTGLSGSHVIPILDSLFGGAGWGHTPTTRATGYTLGSAGGGAGAATHPPPSPLATPGGAQNMGLMGGASGAYNSIPAVAAQNPQTAAALGGPYAAALGALGAGALGTAAGGLASQTTPATQSAAAGVPIGGTGAGGLLGGGGVLGTGMSLGQLLGLGAGGAGLAALLSQMGQGGGANMPNAGQFNALAQEAMGNTGMANALRTGRLPPGAEQMAEAGLQDAQAGIRARYAAMGLSGSTMEGQDLARAQMDSEAQKYQMAQSAANFGMQNMNLADTIYGQIANYQLDQDKQLQDALAAFASAASGGGVQYGLGGQGASQNIMTQAA